ncbi:hypothetical protein CGZ80_15855 [Rhodopirellula sp. MGV]|nr:hypothetical protein CGZ80_15855 [Rhodopirellula sp. MGV]
MNLGGRIIERLASRGDHSTDAVELIGSVPKYGRRTRSKSVNAYVMQMQVATESGLANDRGRRDWASNGRAGRHS